MRFSIVLCGVFIGGCALTTPAPGGPLRGGAYTQLQPTLAVAYGPGSMKVDGVRVSGPAQTRNVGRGDIDPSPNPIPLTAGIRQALGRNVEVSADVGWVDSGVGLRLALPSILEGEPLVLSAGARSGRISVFGDKSYEGRVAVEAYPVLAGAGNHSLRLLLSVGGTAGNFVHELFLPESYRSDSDAPAGPPRARFVRPEIRLQTSVGVFLTREHAGLAVALSPWVLLDADEPTSVVCDECDGPHTITDYEQTWGVSLTIAPSFASDFTR